MAKIRRKVLILLVLVLSMVTTVFIGCNDKYKNMKIEIKGDSEIVLYTNPDGVNETNVANVTISVSGVKSGISKNVVPRVDNENCIDVVVGNPNDDGVSEITITAKQGGTTYVDITTVEGNKSISLLVKVVQKVTSISGLKDKFLVYTNNSYPLDVTQLISFEPSTTSQRNIIFEIVGEAPEGIEIVKQKNGEQALQIGDVASQIITLKATSVDENNKVIEGIEAIEIQVPVIEKITSETLTLRNNTLSKNIDYGESIELVSNIVGDEHVNSIELKYSPKNETTCDIFVDDTAYESMDFTIASVMRSANSNSYIFNITGLSVGKTVIRIEVGLITADNKNLAEGYTYLVEIPVEVVDIPESITVNGHNEDFSGVLFTSYTTFGKEFTVSVGPSTACNFDYVIRFNSAYVTLFNENGERIPYYDIDGEVLKQTETRSAQLINKIYAVATEDAVKSGIGSSISFIAIETLGRENVVQVTFNFTSTQGITGIELETANFENNTIYVEKNNTAILNYNLLPETSANGDALTYDYTQISYEILTMGGDEYISVVRSENPDDRYFTIEGLENSDNLAIRLVSSNGVVSDMVNVKVYTTGSFVTVSLPSVNENTNILQTNYTKITTTAESLTQPFSNINVNEDNQLVATLDDGENIDSPVFASVIATGSKVKFDLQNDPNNKNQTIKSTTFKLVVPEKMSDDTVIFRDFDAKIDKIPATITQGGYLQLDDEGVTYILVTVKFYVGGSENGMVGEKLYQRVLAISSYPKITSVSLKTVDEDSVYNKQGLGDIDVINGEFRTYSFVRLTVGPTSALDKNILREENTALKWELQGVPDKLNVTYGVTAQYKEFNPTATLKLSDINGIVILNDSYEGAYEFGDTSNYMYTRAYIFFNFDDAYFGEFTSKVFELSIQLKQFATNYTSTVRITVNRPVQANSIDLNYVAENVSTQIKQEMTLLDSKYSYELYIDSRLGLNDKNEVMNLTNKNSNLINSWAVKTTMYPSNVTNGKISYIVTDIDGNPSTDIIKVLEDGTIIPLSSGVAYVKITPMSNEIKNPCTLKVRVADGKSWETAYKIYTENDLISISGDETTKYDTMKKFYELANDIYLTKSITPFGVGDDEIVAFSGGLTGSNEYTEKVYTIYNLVVTPTSVSTLSSTDMYFGLFGVVSGQIKELGVSIPTQVILLNDDNSNGAYVGGIAGKIGENAIISGVNVSYNDVTVKTDLPMYFGGIAGYSTGKIYDNTKDVTYSTGYVESVTTKTKVNGTIIIETGVSNHNIGGIVGTNGVNAEIISNYNYFGNTISYNNANDNVECNIKVTMTSLTKVANVGGISGENIGTISNVSAVAKIDANVENAGGIVGINYGTLYQCYNVGQIKNAQNAGGIAGKLDVYTKLSVAIEPKLTLCVTEIIDTNISSKNNITESLIQGTDNVGGLIGYADFSASNNLGVKYENACSTINYCYVRSYISGLANGDIYLANTVGNVGGLIGYAKNVKITNSYADVDIVIDNLVLDLNAGGLIGKLENYSFIDMNYENTTKTFADNILIADCFTTGSMKLYTVDKENIEEDENFTMGQLVGYLSVGDELVISNLIERVYTSMQSNVMYDLEKVSFGLIGMANKDSVSSRIDEGYYLYELEYATYHKYGKDATLNDYVNANTIFAKWSNYGTIWNVVSGANNNTPIIYIEIDDVMQPLYTFVPTKISLSIKEYTEEDQDQLFEKVDTSSSSTSQNGSDSYSKTAVLYIYEDDKHTNEYTLEDLIRVMADFNISAGTISTNQRYIVTTNDSTIVKIVGNKIYPIGEGTCIITICSSYNKEIYDCVQIAVVYHKLDMVFLDENNVEYKEDDIILISKGDGKQIIVYIDSDSTVSGVIVLPNDVDAQNAFEINNQYLGTNIPFQTSSTSTYNNVLSIKEVDYYTETTDVLLNVMPYYTINYYADPIMLRDNNTSEITEYLQQKVVYNKVDKRLLNIRVYVGASEILFSSNDVSSNIGTEITVNITMKTDYEYDSLLVFDSDDVLVMEDDTKDTKIEKEDYTITYFASTKEIGQSYDIYNNTTYFNGTITYTFVVNASNKYLQLKEDDLNILYDAISSNIKFVARSSYINDTISTNINDYAVRNIFNFEITPAVVSSISIQNYEAGRTTSGKYNPKEDPSNSIIPGEVGLLDILITPIYAGITKITLENSVDNGVAISLLQVLQEESTGMYVQSNSLITNIDSGVELNRASKITTAQTVAFDGHIYVRTLIPSEVETDKDLTLILSVYYTEDGQETKKTTSITLTTRQKLGISVSFNGKKYAYVVKGTSITPTSKVIGYTSGITYRSTIEPTYENFMYYFDGEFTGKMKKEDLTEEDLEYLFDSQIKVNASTGETLIGVLIKKGVVITIEASAYEYVNSAGEISTDTLNIYVVDYKIKGITVQGAVNNTLQSICNIPKTLKMKFEVERARYDDYEYEYLQELLSDNVYIYAAQSIMKFFGKDTNYVSSIDEELEQLMREINTYENGIWQFTNSQEGSKREYSSLMIGDVFTTFSIETGSYEPTSDSKCFAIRITEITTISLRAYVQLTFSFDEITNTVKYTFNPEQDKSIVGETSVFIYDFNVESINSTSQDNPLPIYDSVKFEEYIFGTGDSHYILMSNITLNNWTPKDTRVASFDGNGYTITINSFARGVEEYSYFGLFKTISENSIIKNVKVMYKSLNIDYNPSLVNSVNVGLFAYENNGTIFNSSVVGEGETNINLTTKIDSIQNALFVLVNNTKGNISNSRVGYIDTVDGDSNVIHFKSYGDIAGFVGTNRGHIASCLSKDISITSKDQSADSLDHVGVAGFARTNESTGKIYFSYVEGIRGTDIENSQIQMSKLGYEEYNTGIYSTGIIAGFVFSNNGYIQDVYANIPLISPRSSTGFVYSNGKFGEITNAVSLCLQPTTLNEGKEEYPNTSRSQFTGLSDLNEIQNEGSITYSYYYNAGYDSNIYDDLGEPALALPPDAFIDSLDEFGNFVGGVNQIWEVGHLHPQLVSPNRVIKRQRYLINNLTGTETDEELEEYIYYYEDVVDGEYDAYGSFTNPIVISSGVEFITMGSEEYLTPYTNTSSGVTTITTLNQNDYIMIKNVDLSTVIDSGLEKLQDVTFIGMFEGNAYTLENVSILSKKASTTDTTSFGMFSQIGALVLFDNEVLITVDSVEGYHAQIKNLTIEINEISGTHATAVGTLAGVIINADIINIDLLSNDDDKVVTVEGERYVGAVAGYIAGNSTVKNITSNLSVASDFRNNMIDTSQVKPYMLGNEALTRSIYAYKLVIDTKNYAGGYAGGIAGLIDCFKLNLTKNADKVYASVSRNDYDKTGYNYVPINFAPQISSVTVYGEVNIDGDVVGGIVGINCQGSSIYNARFILELGDTQKITGEFIAGGLAGQNYGKIDQSAISHNREVQYQIDSGDIERKEVTTTLFYKAEKFPTYVGGLVGYDEGLGNNSGIITNCYSRVDVINVNATYVGGMVGYMANGYLQYCYTTGNVVANHFREDENGKEIGDRGYAGGGIGYLASFINKSSTKYFIEYTGLEYHSIYSIVCANEWDKEVKVNNTGALFGYVGTSIDLENGTINGDLEIFINNMDKLYDVLFAASMGESYDITTITQSGSGYVKNRLITSYTYEQFKNYANEGANPNQFVIYREWDRSIWDTSIEYFPLLLLNSNANQTYITNEDELRAMGTKGFYIILNDIYLTKDWIPLEGFEGTLTSKKKEDGTYCTIYNININGDCYNTLDSDGNIVEENVGSVGFFSSVKDKAYIYNLNFVFGGNIILPDSPDYVGTGRDAIPVHVQRTKWENYKGEVATVTSANFNNIFKNGIYAHLDYSQLITNNYEDLASGLFKNTYGTGSVAGVANNATFTNITVSFNEFTYSTTSGKPSTTEKASINSNSLYIGGFIGYSGNCKLTNCQVGDGQVITYVKDSNGNSKQINGSAVINVYNNEYTETLTNQVVKNIIPSAEIMLDAAKVIIEFYQQPQCVGGFIGKLDASSSYIRFSGKQVSTHISVYGEYANGKSYSIPSPNLNIGGLIGYSSVASLDSVYVIGTIVATPNIYGMNIAGSNITGLNTSTDVANKTELNIGGVIGVTEKSLYSNCIYQGTIQLNNSKKKVAPAASCIAESTVNIGGVIGKLKGDITLTYGVAIGYTFASTTGYSGYKNPVVINSTELINNLYIGGVLGNSMTLSSKIKKCLFSGIMNIKTTVDNLYVGGILASLKSGNTLTNKATLQSCYTTGTINLDSTVNNEMFVGGIAGKSDKMNASGVASTINIKNVGKSVGKKAVVYVGNFAGMLGYSGTTNAVITDCFTSGSIKITKDDLNGAIGGFVGAMFGTVRTSYSATTITTLSDSNSVSISCTESEKKYISQDGIIGAMFGYSSSILESNGTVTAYYVFDYLGIVMREVESDYVRYGKQLSVKDLAKECVYGTTDEILKNFANSTTASWKTLTYGDYITNASGAYSLPILSFLESDATINKYCRFCETSTNDRIDILLEKEEDDEGTKNELAQAYQLYYGSKLYPYQLKTGNVPLGTFRNLVVKDGIDVNNSYFILLNNSLLDVSEENAFDNINFHLIGYGNSITLKGTNLFAKTLDSERLISSISFISEQTVFNTNKGIIYNCTITGEHTYETVSGFVGTFINTNNGLVTSSASMVTIYIEELKATSKFGGFIGVNKANGVVNSVVNTNTIYLANGICTTGAVAGFIHTVEKGSHILNIISAVSITVEEEDGIEFDTEINAFVNTFTSSDVTLKRVFVDDLSIGYKNAYSFNLTEGTEKTIKDSIYLVNTSYLVNTKDEGNTISGKDTLSVLLGVKTDSDSEIDIKYALAGRNYSYNYSMQYNYGYPYPSLLSYFSGSSLATCLFTGNGTSSNPYIINHAGKLDWMRAMTVDGSKTYFNIVSDIYMNVYNSFTPLFSNATADRFSTSRTYEKDTLAYSKYLCYKGNGTTNSFVINGLVNKRQISIYYLNQKLEENAGLFGILRNDQTVKNLAISYSTIETTAQYAGGLTAELKNGAKINNVGVFNSVITIPTSVENAQVGGLVGRAESVSITKCSADIKIKMTATTSNMYIGGLIGYSKDVTSIDKCYSGTSVILLKGSVTSISSIRFGGLIGYSNNNSSGTKLSVKNSIILTSFDYGGFAGYKFNLTNYSTEKSLSSETLTNEDHIVAFGKIGNVIGQTYKNNETDYIEPVNISNTIYCKGITTIARKYAVGNNYGNDYSGLSNKTYEQCVGELTKENSEYCSLGVKVGSKLKPIKIESQETLENFAKGTDFQPFGLITKDITISAGVDLDQKVLYGNSYSVTTSKSFIKSAKNSIISSIVMKGKATEKSNDACGMVANTADNTIIYSCSIDGKLECAAAYVGGILGYGINTSLIKCTGTDISINSSTTNSTIGGLAGQIDKGGLWYCTSEKVTISSTSKGSTIGGIVGLIPQNNSFAVNCKTEKGTISGSVSGKDTSVGGIVGYLEGLMANAKIGSKDNNISLAGYYVGGITGVIRDGATDIFLNEYTVYVNITDGEYCGGIVAKLGTAYTINGVTVNGQLKGKIVGGVVGTTSDNVKIESSEVKASITSVSSSSSSIRGVGGIVGYATNTTIDGNKVSGAIIGIECVGGIVGKGISVNAKNNEVTSQQIQGSGSNIGGIAGFIVQTSLSQGVNGSTTIEKNTCSSNIKGDKYIGGIVGNITQLDTVVKSNTHSGNTVEGSDYVGGLVGMANLPSDKNSGTVLTLESNKKTKGTITSTSGSAGGLVGSMASSSTKSNTLGNSGALTISGKNAGGIVGATYSTKYNSSETVDIYGDTMSDKQHTISGTECAGGVVGTTSIQTSVDNVTIRASKIEAKGTGSTHGAGGIVGCGEKTDIKWSELKLSSVTATKNAGGVAGYANNIKINGMDIEGKILGSPTITGENAGAYYGYAKTSNLEGKEDNSLTINNITLTSNKNSGNVGGAIGYAVDTNISYINVKGNTKITSSVGSVYGGGVVGYLYGDSSAVKIKNCKVSTSITTSASSTSVGGIVGESRKSSSSNNTIEKCTFSGASISNAQNVGGIVGKAYSTAIKENNITSDLSLSGTNAGGIVGEATDSTIENKTTNTVKIKTVSGASNAGGIAGSVTNTSILNFTLSSLTNVSSSSGCAGGIVGKISTSVRTLSITGISISTSFAVAGKTSAGGVAGSATGNGSNLIKPSDISYKISSITATSSAGGIIGNCTYANIGDVTIKSAFSVNAKNAGGLVGNMDNSTIVSSVSVNYKMTVTGEDNAGGIAGNVGASSVISGPSSISVAVTSSKGNAGGAVGKINSNTASFSMTISGTVKGSKNTGGVAGYAQQIKVSSCGLSSLTVSATEGDTYGGIVGYADSCKISGTSIKSGLSISGVKYAGSAVGNMVNGTLSVAVGSSFSFTASCAGGSFGSVVGKNSGTVTVSSSGMINLSVTVSAGNNAGGFIGENSGTLSVPGVVISSRVYGSASCAGGIMGYNSGTLNNSSFKLYYQVKGGTTAGVFAGGSGDMPDSPMIIVHKYTTNVTGAASATNQSCANYASAYNSRSGTASYFTGGDTYGSRSYMVYPGERSKYTFDAQFTPGSTSYIYRFAPSCTYENLQISTVSDKLGYATYIKSQPGNVYLQCTLTAGESKAFAFRNYSATTANDGGKSHDGALSEFAEAYFKGIGVSDKRKLFTDFITAPERTMASYFMTDSKANDFGNGDYSSLTLGDVADALEEYCGGGNSFSGNSWNELRNDFNNTTDKILFWDTDPIGFDIGNDVKYSTIKMWAYSWKNYRRNLWTSAFSSDASLRSALYMDQSSFTDTAKGISDSGYSTYKSIMENRFSQFKNNSIISGTTLGGLGKGGAEAYYDGSCYMPSSLSSLASGITYQKDGNEHVYTDLTPIRYTISSTIDKGWTTDNPNYITTVQIDLQLTYKYEVKVTVSPTNGLNVIHQNNS